LTHEMILSMWRSNFSGGDFRKFGNFHVTTMTIEDARVQQRRPSSEGTSPVPHEPNGATGHLDTHPLVHEYFGEQIRTQRTEDWNGAR
jgi:hypothetical protein